MALQKTPMTLSPSPAKGPAAPIPPAASKQPFAGKKPVAPGGTSFPFWIGLSVSIAWVAAVLMIIAKAGPAHSLGGIPLVDWAIGISAAVSPVAMVWMVTAYLQRAADIETIADPLRRQLTLITGESGAADARIRRFNAAIREQIELLRSAQTISQDDLEAVMDRVRQHRSDLERFENSSTQQIKEIQDVVRRSMFQLEQMMDDKFTMLRVLDGKLQQNGDGVARQVESVGENIARLLEEIEHTGRQVADALERAKTDSQKLADTSHLQASSLTSASEAAAETLGGLSSKIDLSVARFLERASSAREEAERLAATLDAQTRALDEFSTTLPVRVSEAEAVLRGVADRLYASEQMAREQAVHLSEKLSLQVDGLQGFMDRFTGRLSDIDASLDRRHTDLNGLAERIHHTTSGFVASWEKSVTDLNDRTGNALLRFTVVNDETRRNADSVVAHLNETTGKYEDVVLRMRALSTDSSAEMKGMTEEVTRHLTQFEALSKASTQAGEEVQERANRALQNLQHVLERVLAAREATQAVGETLVKDINLAVDQNEKMIQRLSETAQLGARAIGAATDSLGRQEGELAGKARAGEAVLVESVQKLQQQAQAASENLRAQTGTLMGLLAETQGQLITTDQKLQAFAAQAVAPVQKAVQQIDASADQGLRTLSHYGEGLTSQVSRLQDFHARIGGMSEEMGKTTAETVGAFENLSTRFAAARAAQEDSVRQTLAQFSDLSERLQRETAGFDGHAARSVELLQQAALKVGEQSYQMLENAQSSSAQIKDVASALQSEASQIQSFLHGQAEEINNGLARAEQKFTAIGETIRERAEAAYAMLDRTAAHYGDVSQKLDQVGAEAVRMETQAMEIAAGSSRAVQNLSSLNDKMSATHQAATAHAQQTFNKIEEASSAFERRASDMREVAQSATDAVLKAGGVFGEQTGKLVDGSHQIDGVLRQLTQATGALADQAAQIRISMEQQNNRLLAQLTESVAQLDVTGGKLQQVVSVAVQGADQASGRFTDMTETASRRVGSTTQELLIQAERAETTLAALGANVTQQAASLAVVGDQIGEQQRLLSAASEKQRAQMLDLFDRLGAAHAQASEIAGRSISYLTDSLQEIHRQMGLVGDQSQTTVGNVKMASMAFSDQAAQLLQNAQAAEQQARTVLSVTSALQEQARHLRESLQSESDRAGESLGALLERLTAGGGEVRELGATTGAMLTSLQRALGDQAGELNLSMQQISDRQRSLTASLEQQRENINMLLNRFTLAQDETAAAAERAAERISEGAQKITGSIDLIGAQASTTLVNIQASVDGFAEQATAIKLHSQQAEQQVRGVLSVTTGMQEQASHLREAMQVETARMVEQLASVIAQLDLSGRHLKTETVGAVQAFDQTAQRFASAAEAGDKAEQQARQLADVAEFATARLVKLRDTFDLGGKDGQDIVAAATRRIEDVKAALQDQLQHLSAFSQEAVEQMGGAAQTLAAQSDALRANLAASESALGEAAELMREESKQLPATLNRGAVAIETAARVLKEKAAEADQSMIGTADRFIAVTAAARNNMIDEMQRVGDVADRAADTLGRYGQMLAAQVTAMQQGATTLSSEQKELVERTAFSVDALAEAGSKLAALRAEAAVTAERLAHDFALLDQRATATGERLAQAGEGLAKQVEAIDEVSARAESQMAGVGGHLREQLERIRAGLQGQIDDINRGLTQITVQLERTGASLRSTAVGAVADVERVGQRFEQTGGEAAAQVEIRTQQMRRATEDVAKIMAGFGAQFDAMLAHMAQAGDGIKHREGDMLTHLQSMLAHLGDVAGKLESARALSGDVSQHAIQRLDEVVNAVQAQMNSMAAGAQTAAGIMRGIGQIYSDQTGALTKGVGEAHNQVLTMNQSIDDMQQRTDRMRAALKLQGDELMNSLRQILSQLEMTGDGLSDAVNHTLQQQAATALKKIS